MSLAAVGDSAAQAGQGPRRGALVMAEASVPSWDANFSPGAADQCTLERFFPNTFRAPREHFKFTLLIFPFIADYLLIYLADLSLGPSATLYLLHFSC